MAYRITTNHINIYIQALFNIKHATQTNPNTALLCTPLPLQCAQGRLRQKLPIILQRESPDKVPSTGDANNQHMWQ